MERTDTIRAEVRRLVEMLPDAELPVAKRVLKGLLVSEGDKTHDDRDEETEAFKALPEDVKKAIRNSPNAWLATVYGSIPDLPDGMQLQKEMRSEWE